MGPKSEPDSRSDTCLEKWSSPGVSTLDRLSFGFFFSLLALLTGKLPVLRRFWQPALVIGE